jgi:hypothetical protein
MRVGARPRPRERQFKKMFMWGIFAAFFALLLGISMSGGDGAIGIAATCLVVGGVGFFALSPLFCLLYLMLFKLQASLMEFLFIMCCAANVFGLLMRSVLSGDRSTFSRSPFLGAFIALVAVYMVLGGAVWGLSASRRLEERRPWRRVGLIVLGMGIYPALAAVVVGGATALTLALNGEPANVPILLFVVMGTPVSLLWTLAFAHIESKCRRRVGEERIF